MTIDLGLIQDIGTGEFDLAIIGGDLAATSGLATAVLVSIFTDARALPDEIRTAVLRGGWIGDSAPPVEEFKLGSRIWLTEPAKLIQSTANIVSSYALAALQWMIDQGIASNVEVEGVLRPPYELGLNVRITAPTGEETSQYVALWRQTSFQPTRLPLPIVDNVPFTPLSVPDLVVWGSAKDSAHEVDAFRGVSVAFDIAEHADYFQPDAAKRPLLLRSNAWFYRADGSNDSMVTANQLFGSMREGSALFTYKPTAAATNGRRFFSIGVNGFTDSVFGLSFRQEASNTIRFHGDNGEIQVDLSGPDDGELPVGVLYRWGPAAAGADGETTDGVAATDPEFTNEMLAPNMAVWGAGFDGSGPDGNSAGFENSDFAFWSRRVSDLEAFRLLEWSGTRLWLSPIAESFDDGFFFEDPGPEYIGWEN